MFIFLVMMYKQSGNLIRCHVCGSFTASALPHCCCQMRDLCNSDVCRHDTSVSLLQAAVVTTTETVRVRFFMDLLIARQRPVMLVGAAGTGKTVLMNNKLASLGEWVQTDVSMCRWIFCRLIVTGLAQAECRSVMAYQFMFHHCTGQHWLKLIFGDMNSSCRMFQVL